LSEVTIKKAKLVKKGESFDVLYERITEEEKAPVSVSETHKTPVHPDMRAAFDNLRIHLAVLCGYVLKKEVKDIETPKEELYNAFHVTAFSMGKDKDDPGIVLSGHKILANGKAQILNCPFTRFEEGEQSVYPFVDDLVKKVARLQLEINAYLFEGKRADDPQQQLPFGEDGEKVTKMQIAQPEFFNTTAGGKMPAADPEAQARVLNDGEPAPKKGRGRPKRVAQTADAPGGLVDGHEEPEEQPAGIDEEPERPREFDED
jgi:hypothetical protein